MKLAENFDRSVPPYLIGEKYGNEDIETFLKDVEILCAGSHSPCLEDEEVSVTECIARAHQIPENNDAAASRHYLHDIERAIVKLQDWQMNPQNRITDSFYEVFASFDIMRDFREWASPASKYYDVRSPSNVEIAARDLETAIIDLQDTQPRSPEEAEAWGRGEDAFYYLMNNGFTPATPEKIWRAYAAQGAYLFSIDNMNDNEEKRIGGLKRVKKDADYDGPLTDSELTRIVLFEARFPASRGSEMSFMMDHITDTLPYGKELGKFYGLCINYFNALSRTSQRQLEPEL